MSKIYRIPCGISATNNDHLRIISVDIAEETAPHLITGLRAMQTGKLDQLVFWDPYRNLTVSAHENGMFVTLGDRKTAPVSYENLSFIENYALDWLLELCPDKTRCTIALTGTNELRINLILRLRKSAY